MQDQTATTVLPPGRPGTLQERRSENSNVRRFKITGDVVNQATADLPDEQRSLIRRLHAHAWENDLPLTEVGTLIGYDSTTLHRAFNGTYEGSLANVCEAIARFFRLYDARATGRKLGFITTRLSKRIWQVCQAALEMQRVAFIIGESQIGKSTALVAYAQAHNHGQTIYVEIPAGGAMINFLRKFARALRINVNQNERQLREDIFDAIDDKMLLIFDEVHRCIPTTGSTRRLLIIDFIKELHDATRCGVVLSATNVFRDAMDEKQGPVAKMLRQIVRRQLCTLLLPDLPTEADLNRFAAAHKLPPATGEYLKLQTEVIGRINGGLGMWLNLLRSARKVADEDKQRLTWAHVIEADAGLKTLADPTLSIGTDDDEGGAL